MALAQTEKELQHACVQLLQMYENANRLLFIRNNSFAGKITRADGSQGFIKNNKLGAPDLFIFLPKGRTLHVELKSETGKLRPEQTMWHGSAERLLHYYHVIRSLDKLVSLLKFYGV